MKKNIVKDSEKKKKLLVNGVGEQFCSICE